MIAIAVAALPALAGPAARSCAHVAANGTGASRDIAQFQVYENLLQSTDGALWANWIGTGATPGYAVKPVKYTCTEGTGLGVTCRGRTKICKL